MMTSEEEILNMTARREVLRSLSLSDTEMSVEQNLQCGYTNNDSLIHQQVAEEDVPEMAQLLDAKMQSVEQIIEEEQAHGVQVAALSQMQLQTNGEGGRTGEGVEEAQYSDGRVSGCVKIIT